MSTATQTPGTNKTNLYRPVAKLTAAELEAFAGIVEEDTNDLKECLNTAYRLMSSVEDDYFMPGADEDTAEKSSRLVAKAEAAGAAITACRRLLAQACTAAEGLCNALLASRELEQGNDRKKSIIENWNEETKDPATHKWRADLSASELAHVQAWDELYMKGTDDMGNEIAEKQAKISKA